MAPDAKPACGQQAEIGPEPGRVGSEQARPYQYVRSGARFFLCPNHGPTDDQSPAGLRLPAEWQEHYGAVYVSELPWTISGIMQSVMLGNPAAGESKPWKSR